MAVTEAGSLHGTGAPVVVYRVAETIAERDRAQSLIEAVFVAGMGLSGICRDEFDAVASFVLGDADGVAVAALRIVPDGPAGLPLDRHVCLAPLRSPSTSLAEVGRLVVLPEYRRHLVGVRGVPFLRDLAQRLGLTHLVVDSMLSRRRLYEHIGFVRWGEPFYDPTALEPGAQPGVPNGQVLVARLKELEGWQ